MTPLTPRQAEVLDFIRRHLGELGYPPTSRDISSAFGFAHHTGGECYLRALAKKGYIRRAGFRSRGIKILGAPCPCCGGTGVAPAAEIDT